MSTYILDIVRYDTGYQFDLDTVPTGGYDIWLDGERIATRYDDTAFFYPTPSRTPPPIEFVAAWEDTTSIYAAGKLRIQWNHFGAAYYIIERSTNGTDFFRFGSVPANGNTFHNFEASVPSDMGAVYYRVYAAALDNSGVLLKYSLPIECMVIQPMIPAPPVVNVSVDGGDAVIQAQSVLTDDVELRAETVTSEPVTGEPIGTINDAAPL